MSLTLLILVAVVTGLAAVYVVTTRQPAVEVLASETTLAGAADPANETLTSDQHAPPTPRCEWQLATVSDLGEAEELLDTLEHQGVTERELVVLGNACFAVRWR